MALYLKKGIEEKFSKSEFGVVGNLLIENGFKEAVSGGYFGPNNCYVSLPKDGIHVEVAGIGDDLLKKIISILSPTCYIDWKSNGTEQHQISKLVLK